MISLRCPRCSTTIEAVPGAPAQCPTCGFFAAAPLSGVLSPSPPGAAPIYSSAPRTDAAAPVALAYAPQAVAGKPRPFWLSLLLGVVTLGVYFYVWNYVTFRELDREHSEDHASGWYWSALAAQVAAILVFVAGSAVATFQSANQAETGPVAKVPINDAFLYAVLGLQLISTGIFLGYVFQEIAKVETYRQRHGLPEGFAPVWFVILYVLGPVLAASTVIAAYFFVTRSVNDLWNQVYSEKGIPVP